MNVSLTPRLEELVNQKVASGLYNSASEVIREALRLLDEKDRVREMRIEELRKQVAVGIEQLDRGEYTEYDEDSLNQMFEDVKIRGRKRLAEERRMSKDHQP